MHHFLNKRWGMKIFLNKQPTRHSSCAFDALISCIFSGVWPCSHRLKSFLRGENKDDTLQSVA